MTPTTSASLTEKVAEVVCVVCGASLVGQRRDARQCSAACRAEASRIRAILDGTYPGRYRSLAERLAKRRTGRPLPFPQRKAEEVTEAHTGALVTLPAA